MTANGLLLGDQNVLKVDCGDGCKNSVTLQKARIVQLEWWDFIIHEYLKKAVLKIHITKLNFNFA